MTTLTIKILSNISRSKSNKAMKFGQVIQYNNRNTFLINHAENLAGRLVLDLFLSKKALSEFKAKGLQLNIFQQFSTWHTIKTYCITLKTIDPETCSILIFQKKIWEQFLHHILCMIFQEKCFSCYILLTDKISLPDCLYFLRYQS